MTTALYRRGGKKRYQGYLVTRLDTADERVHELCQGEWFLTPKAVYASASVPTSVPEPEPQLELELEPEPKPTPRKKKKKKYRRT